MDPNKITREYVASQLVAKHEKALNVTQEEFEKYTALESELDKAAEEYKTSRDGLNDQVQQLKDSRQNYYSESRNLRTEFVTKLKKKKSMSDIPMEVLILTKQIDQFEWEIQTEAVNVDAEKKLVKRIQENLEKLHNYANMYQEHEEVSKAVKKLTSKLNKTTSMAHQKHEEMLKAVDKSDDFHKKFVDVVVKLRDARAKRVGFQRELDKHESAMEHWKSIVEFESRRNKKKKQTKKINEEEGKQIPKQIPKQKPKEEAKDIIAQEKNKIDDIDKNKSELNSDGGELVDQ